MESILVSIKKHCGIDAEYVHFDQDIMFPNVGSVASHTELSL